MKRWILFLTFLAFLLPSVAWGQGSLNTVPPACTAASLLLTCVPQIEGVIARVTDADDGGVLCTGGGSTTVACQFDGSAWVVVPTGGSTWTGADGDTITNPSAGTFLFTKAEAGTVVFSVTDGSTPTALTITAEGSGALTLGASANGTVNILSTSNINIGDVNTNAIAINTTGGIDLGSSSTDDVTFLTDAGSTIIDGDITIVVDETATFGAPNELFATPAGLDQFIGIPKLNVTQLGDGIPDGSTLAEGIDPLIASCAPITAGTEAAGSLFITGTASYQYTAQGTAADNDGFDCDVTGPTTGNGTDSIGFWFRTDTALTAGTLDVSLEDGGTGIEANADLPGVSVVDEWQWIEVDFASDCDSTCTGIDGFHVQVTAAGAATSEMDGTIIHIDSGAIWLDTAEAAIGDVLVGGVISVSVALVVETGANTASELVEYTDYIVNYQSGADALVFLGDQTANYGWTLEALQ